MDTHPARAGTVWRKGVRAAKSRPDDRRLSTGGRKRQCAARLARHSAQSSGHNVDTMRALLRCRCNATTRRHT
eukprot:4302694-Prymnesium_polylepis.1